jgi:hypothetical protein
LAPEAPATWFPRDECLSTGLTPACSLLPPVNSAAIILPRMASASWYVSMLAWRAGGTG